MSSNNLDAVLFKSLEKSIEDSNRNRIAKAEQIVGGLKLYKPARKPGLVLTIAGFGLSFAYAASGGENRDVAAALSVVSMFGLIVLITSFFQMGYPKEYQAEFKLTQKRYGRDPVAAALKFAAFVAIAWLAGTGLILALDSAAAGAGVPFMVVWSFLGLAFGLAAFVNLLRSFFILRSYRKDIWEKFLAEIG